MTSLDKQPEARQRRPVIENFSWLVVANVVTKPLWFLFLIILTRFLGPAGFGTFQFHLSVAYFLCLMMDLGIDQVVVREVAIDAGRALSYGGTLALLKLALGVLTVAISCFLPSFFPRSVMLAMVIAATSGQAVSTGLTHARAYFRAFERLDLEAYSTLVEKVLVVLFAVVALLASGTIEVVFWGFAAANILAFAFTAYLVNRLFPLRRVAIDAGLLPGILRRAFPFALMGIFALIYTRTDTLLLQRFRGSYDVGIYQGAFRYIEFLIFLPGLLAAPVFPRLSRLLISSPVEARHLVARVVKWLAPGTLMVSLGLSALSPQVVMILLGPQYGESVRVFTLLVWLLPPVAFNFLFGTVLASAGKQGIATTLAGVAAAINVGINLLLIPQIGVMGAVAATLVATFVQALFTTALGTRVLESTDLVKSYVRLLLAVGCGAVAWFFGTELGDPGRLAAPFVAAVVFVGVLWKSGFLNASDVRSAKATLQHAVIRLEARKP